MTRRRVTVLTKSDCLSAGEIGGAIAEALSSRHMEATVEPVGPDLDLHLRRVKPSIAFMALEEHSPWASRTLGLLELLGVPSTGSSNLTSSLCRDKSKTLRLLGAGGLPVPAHVVVHKDYIDDTPVHLSGLSCPIEVSSAIAGEQAIRVTRPESLASATHAALSNGPRAIAFEVPTARRLSGFVLDQTFLGAVETTPNGRDQIAPLSPTLASHVARMSRQAHQTMDCMGLAEIEFLVSDLHPISVLGVLPNPSLAPKGRAALAASNAGISYKQLICDLTEQAFRIPNSQKRQGTGRGVA